MVNGEEISALQFSRAVNAAGINVDQAVVRRMLVNKLIDRELAVQRALAAGLDRDADVMLRLEEARRDILARAYAKKLVEGLATPDEQAITHYYSSHPELFSNRKLFTLEERRVVIDPAKLPAALETLKNLREPREFQQWVDSQASITPWQRIVRAAESVPMEALARIGNTKLGEVAYFSTPNGVLIYRVLNMQEAPLTFEQARPVIVQYFQSRESNAYLEREMQHLRRNASVEYYGEFKGLMQAHATRE